MNDNSHRTDQEALRQSTPFDDFVIHPGTIVTCPHCSLYIARVVKPIRNETKLTSDLFDGPGISHGGECKCHRCNMPWFLPEVGRIHTNRGWMPPEIQIATGKG